jgi:4-carboxymuconolactone decarboxylase
MPRITPITGKADVPAEHHDVVDAVVRTFSAVRGPFSVLLHSPELTRHLVGLVDFFRAGCIVEQKLRSLAALVAARERGGDYVWSAQVDVARRAGVREEFIDLIRGRGDVNGFPPAEREIIAFAQQLARDSKVEQATFDALLRRHGEKWLVEMTASTCYYIFQCGVASVFAVPSPPGKDRLPL